MRLNGAFLWSLFCFWGCYYRARKNKSGEERVEVIMKVHTASFRLTGHLSSHSSWTVWMFPLAAEDKTKQESDNELKHTGVQRSQLAPIWSRTEFSKNFLSFVSCPDLQKSKIIKNESNAAGLSNWIFIKKPRHGNVTHHNGKPRLLVSSVVQQSCQQTPKKT